MFRRVHRLAYGWGVRLGMVRYSPPWVLAPSDWDNSYASGSLDFYASLREQARYGVLTGYIRSFPRKPRILDIGSGVGVLRSRIPDETVSGYVGIDPSAVAVSEGQSKGFANSTFQVGERPTPDLGLFDLIVLNEMLYYVRDLEGLMASLRPHLAPDGWVLTSTLRHPGDVALDRSVARHFKEIDSVVVARDCAPKNAWRLACYASA